MSKTTQDSLVAGGLALALLMVIGLDKLMTKPSAGAVLEEVTPTKSPVRAKQLRLAVSQTKKDIWDDMAKLLDHLGAGYKYRLVPVDDLYNPKTFDEFDVLFLTCSSVGNDPAVAANVRQFVARGGTLYASDWRYLVVAQAFPDMVDRKALGDGKDPKDGEGKDQRLVADVLDPGLQDALGMQQVPLEFNLDQWKIAAFGGDRVKVLMKASRYKTQKDTWGSTPLLVKFGFDKGTVIFTSFHNEAQNSEVEQKLLKYLVFSAVTAQIENEINQTMLKGGFSPQKSNLLSASGKAEMSHTYRSKKPGQVRFILGFQEQGARLKLTVTSPDGNKRELEGTSTLVIEQSCPTVGDWRYTVTALEVPFPDFPFTLTVGESQ